MNTLPFALTPKVNCTCPINGTINVQQGRYYGLFAGVSFRGQHAILSMTDPARKDPYPLYATIPHASYRTNMRDHSMVAEVAVCFTAVNGLHLVPDTSTYFNPQPELPIGYAPMEIITRSGLWLVAGKEQHGPIRLRPLKSVYKCKGSLRLTFNDDTMCILPESWWNAVGYTEGKVYTDIFIDIAGRMRLCDGNRLSTKPYNITGHEYPELTRDSGWALHQLISGNPVRALGSTDSFALTEPKQLLANAQVLTSCDWVSCTSVPKPPPGADKIEGSWAWAMERMGEGQFIKHRDSALVLWMDSLNKIRDNLGQLRTDLPRPADINRNPGPWLVVPAMFVQST